MGLSIRDSIWDLLSYFLNMKHCFFSYPSFRNWTHDSTFFFFIFWKNEKYNSQKYKENNSLYTFSINQNQLLLIICHPLLYKSINFITCTRLYLYLEIYCKEAYLIMGLINLQIFCMKTEEPRESMVQVLYASYLPLKNPKVNRDQDRSLDSWK